MPPRIVNQSQQMQAGIVSPPALYSRVVGLFLELPADGNWYHAITPSLGLDVTLWRVTVRHCPRGPNTANYSLFEIMAGGTKALTLAEIGVWDRVIPHIAQGGPFFSNRFGDGCNLYEETMRRLYTGEDRRFGVLGKRVGAGTDQLFITFEISEG